MVKRMSRLLRVLIVEDNADDAELQKRTEVQRDELLARLQLHIAADAARLYPVRRRS